MQNNEITIVGGDCRNLLLGKLFSWEGNKVTIFGFKEEIKNENCIYEDDLSKALEASDIIIGPVPFEEDGKLNLFKSHEPVFIEDLFKKLEKDKIFIAGYISVQYKKLASNYEFTIFDLYEREEMRILNAIPTAEGYVQMAMEGMDITIHGSKTLILGYGRVGEVLAGMIDGLGADLHVAARSHKDLSWIRAHGYRSIKLEDLKEELGNFDLILNTIPRLVLNKTLLREVNEKTLIVDNASNPGGVDYEEAKKTNLTVMRYLGLPGKVVGLTAAKCMKETIENIFDEL